MFTESAAIYDAIYTSFHDFLAETEQLHALIQRTKRTPDNDLLDVACGTGAYLAPLSRSYVVEGLDVDRGMLAVAGQKVPGIPLHHADMAEFDLGRRFDAVVCLGSSIGYVKTLDRLRQTLKTFAWHTLPGGVVVVEPWFTPATWEVGRLHGLFVNRPDMKITRMSVSGAEGSVSVLDFHYLVATSAGVKHTTERHEMGLFTHEEYLTAFRRADLDVAHDPAGLIGRGLYIGTPA